MTHKQQKQLIYLLTGIVLLLLITTGIILAVTGKEPEAPPFSPPPFEKEAKTGEPTVPDGLGWSAVYKDGMSFRSSVCGEIRIREGKAAVFFTNHEENTLFLKLRILNESGDVLAESGLLRPGEYLENITFSTLPEQGETLVLRLMSYQPETYYSGGSVTLTTVATLED